MIYPLDQNYSQLEVISLAEDWSKHEAFILGRVEGKSYDKLAGELGVDRRTLFRWGHEHEDEIDALEQDRLQELRKKYQVTKEARLKWLGENLQKLTSELMTRDDIVDLETGPLTSLVLRHFQQ